MRPRVRAKPLRTRLLALFLTAVASLACTQGHTDPSDIKAWIGKYPHDRIRNTTFLDNPEVQRLIKNVIGESSISASAIPQMKLMATVSPIREEKGWLIAKGCQPHLCSDGNWALAINLTNLETRLCLASVGSSRARFAATGRNIVLDLPRPEGEYGVLKGCPTLEAEVLITFDRAFAGLTPWPQAVPATPSFAAPNQYPSSGMRVALKQNGGTFVVPIEINGSLTLDFVVDSGAADVSIPMDVFSTLMRTGTIKNSDILGEATYVMADGSKSKSAQFTIRSLKIGDKVVQNVKGSVASPQGSLLLGQSFLGRFKTWSIDNTKHELLLETQ